MRLIYALLILLLVGCEAAEGRNEEKQKIITGTCSKEYTLTSWNAGNFGKSKSAETLVVMADILKSSDIVFLQEVSTGPAGAQATERLQSALDQKGTHWDSLVSDATSGDGPERYSTLWKPSRVQVQRKNSLVMDLADSIDREPHENVVTIEGIFGPKGWTAHIDGKTSLKQKLGPSGEYLLYQYDHILSKGSIKVIHTRIIDFVTERYSPITNESLRSARLVSDHLPVSMRFQVCRS